MRIQFSRPCVLDIRRLTSSLFGLRRPPPRHVAVALGAALKPARLGELVRCWIGVGREDLAEVLAREHRCPVEDFELFVGEGHLVLPFGSRCGATSEPNELPSPRFSLSGVKVVHANLTSTKACGR